VTGPIGEDDLQAAVDGRVEASRSDIVEAYLRQNPDAAARVAALQAARTELRARLAAKAAEPIPARLRVASLAATRRRRPTAMLLRVAAVLALLLIGGAAGWTLRDLVGRGPEVAGMTRDAIAAHRVFVVERRHPVEVAANEEAHLVQWLSNRLGQKLTAPDLAAQGWRLMGGRLLASNVGPAAQLMYENGAGQRTTVYLRPGDGKGGAEFRYAEADGVGAFWWVDGGLGYAVSGPADRQLLFGLAEAIHAQVAGR
jgi:anti-sigma factor RsiW